MPGILEEGVAAVFIIFMAFLVILLSFLDKK